MEKLADISAFTELENGRGISSCFNWMPPAAARRKQNTGAFGRTLSGIMQDRERYIRAANAPALAAAKTQEEAAALMSNIQGALIKFNQDVGALGNKRFTQIATSLQSAIAHAQQTKDFRFAEESIKRVGEVLRSMTTRLDAQSRAVQSVSQDLQGVVEALKVAHSKKLL
ncbi:MAG: hypothetical protein IK105_06305 [Thermoguttaceae bacterium]|nr:hypothetical protein [Thermoguttaceae bacterium]